MNIFPSREHYARFEAESEYPGLWHGLIGLWSTSLGPTGLTLRDWSLGYPNHGAFTNMEAGDWGVYLDRYALNYDGNDEFVDCGQNISLDMTGSYTIGAWVKATSVPAARSIIVSRFNDGDNAGHMMRFESTGEIRGIHRQQGVEEGGTIGNSITSAGTYDDSKWHFVVHVFAMGVGSELFVDALSVGTDNTSVAAIGSFTQDFCIGAQDHVPGPRYYLGQIGDVFNYNRALAYNEIADMDAGAHPLILKRHIYGLAPAALYTRGDEIALPGDDADLETAFSSSDYTDVETDNNVYVVQTANSGDEPFSIFEWKDKHSDDEGIIIVQCIAKSDLAPTSSPVVLQIYNRNSTAWETLASNGAAGAGVEFTLNGEQAAALADYYDADFWVACRVYQEAP